jgi:tungstate transport system substrate-binding protein
MRTRLLSSLRGAALLALLLGPLLALAPAFAAERLRLSTTTSTENSGLLQTLLPLFEKASGVHVDVIAVGTGKALKLGESGDVDVVLVHDPGLEEAFVAKGFGVDRRAVMHNDFVVVGPQADPAAVRGAASAVEAFQRLAAGKATFVSRGDESGTHQKEKALWAAAGRKPPPASYLEAGQGMGEVLQMAAEKRAYTLSDRGTYLALAKKLDLVVLHEGDAKLFNPYSVIAVNPAKAPHAKADLAKKFIDFLTGPEGQKAIAAFQVDGKQLFFPDARK